MNGFLHFFVIIYLMSVASDLLLSVQTNFKYQLIALKEMNGCYHTMLHGQKLIIITNYLIIVNLIYLSSQVPLGHLFFVTALYQSIVYNFVMFLV